MIHSALFQTNKPLWNFKKGEKFSAQEYAVRVKDFVRGILLRRITMVVSQLIVLFALIAYSIHLKNIGVIWYAQDMEALLLFMGFVACVSPLPFTYAAVLNAFMTYDNAKDTNK